MNAAWHRRVCSHGWKLLAVAIQIVMFSHSSDNHARILNEAGGPEEACQRQENVPAVLDQRRARHSTVLRQVPGMAVAGRE